MLKNFIVILLLIILIQGCDTTEPPIIESEPLIPLSLGNYWIYQGYYLNPDDGSINTEETGKFGFIIHEPPLSRSDTLSLNAYQISICTEDLLPIEDTSYLLYGGSKLVYQDDEGFYYRGIVRKDSVVLEFNDIIFRNKIKKGESLLGHVFFYSPLGNGSNVPDEAITEYTCVSIDSIFTTPVGSLRCIVYKMTYTDFEPLFRNEVYYFISPGVGIVGTVEKTYHYSLDRYRYFKKYILTNYKKK